jgi:hypothetical protein
VAHGSGGDVHVRFSPENPYGVLDHWVTLPDGTELYMPLRVVANGDGAEVHDRRGNGGETHQHIPRRDRTTLKPT